MSATIYVEPGTDTRVVDVAGANPAKHRLHNSASERAADRSAYGPRLHRPALPGLDR
jgi:hypothetical protein